jgi:hypothetical protein
VSGTAENLAGAAAIRPFTIPVAPEAELAALRARIEATRWAERAYPKLIYFNELDRGNHFAAWQEPALFSGELRAAFRSLR